MPSPRSTNYPCRQITLFYGVMSVVNPPDPGLRYCTCHCRRQEWSLTATHLRSIIRGHGTKRLAGLAVDRLRYCIILEAIVISDDLVGSEVSLPETMD